MALPTTTITPGTGLTINTLPNGGQAVMASSLPVTMASDQPAMPISATSLPLPTGAGTAANQSTMITSLNTIATNTPAIGQKASAASAPVVIASDQPAVAVSATSLPLPTGAATSALQGTGNTSLAAIATSLGGPLSVVGNIAKFQAQFGPASSTAYTTGMILSAPIQVTGMGRVAGGSGVITGAELALNVANVVEVDLIVMTAAPAGTYAAGGTWTNNAADRAKISQVLKVTDWTALSTTDSVGEVVPSSKLYTCDDGTNTQSLWVIPVTRGAVTLASATDATLTIRASRN